jgi:hypothetical protein
MIEVGRHVARMGESRNVFKVLTGTRALRVLALDRKKIKKMGVI